MKRSISGLLLLAVLVVLIAAGVAFFYTQFRSDRGMMQERGMMDGQDMMQDRGMMDGSGMGRMSMARHRYIMRNGMAPAYADRSSPLQPTTELLRKGQQLYNENCASCHGRSGHGEGEAAQGLDPQPTNIADFSQMPMASDAYLYWTLAEGGAPVGSAMPAFKDALEENEIWAIIMYLRESL